LNSQPDYREKLEVELKELRESEMWQAGKTVRSYVLKIKNKPVSNYKDPESVAFRSLYQNDQHTKHIIQPAVW